MNKARLRAFRAQAKEMSQLLDSIERMTALKGPKITNYEGGGTGGGSNNGSPIERSVEKIIELETRYADMLGTYAKNRGEIEDAIEPLPSNEKAVIRAYYLDGLTWEATAYLLGFSYQHVHRLHSNALHKLHESEKDAR